MRVPRDVVTHSIIWSWKKVKGNNRHCYIPQTQTRTFVGVNIIMLLDVEVFMSKPYIIEFGHVTAVAGANVKKLPSPWLEYSCQRALIPTQVISAVRTSSTGFLVYYKHIHYSHNIISIGTCIRRRRVIVIKASRKHVFTVYMADGLFRLSNIYIIHTNRNMYSIVYIIKGLRGK